jgi:hypothetical protein
MKIQKSELKTQNDNLKVFSLLAMVLSFALFALSFAPSANAESIDLGVFPPIIQIDAKSPADVENPISIENFSNSSLTLDIVFRPFKPLENGDIEYLDQEEAVEFEPLFSKVSVYDQDQKINKITLSPKQKKDLKLRIEITPDQKPSEYYFSTIFISEDLSNIGSTQSLAIGGIATNVILSVGPVGTTKGKISQFSAPFFLLKGPVPFTVKVANESSHYITTNGIITIKDIFGKTVGKIDLLPVNVLANSERLIPSTNVRDPQALWNEKFLLGIYSAKAVVGLSEEGPILSKTTTFFALPLELLAGVVASTAIVAFIVKRIREKQSSA